MFLDYMSPAEYHARNEISASMIKKCDPPARLRWSLDNHEEPTPEMRLGTAVHELVFTGKNNFLVKPERLNFATKDGKQWKLDNSKNLDRLLTHEQEQTAIACQQSVLKTFLGAAKGETDLACILHDQTLRADCRCLYDFVPTYCDYIVDLKTTRAGGAGKRQFEREVMSRGYHLQAGWYLRLWNTYHKADRSKKRYKFIFVVVETEAPFLTAIYELSSELIQAGEAECVKRAEMIRDCMESGKWPGYHDIQTIEKPKWMSEPEADTFTW